MSKGSPSMIALLGMLAVAGYQNRDKLSGLLQQASARPRDGSVADRDDETTGAGDFLRQNFGGANGGIMGGLSDLLNRFTNPVQSAKAQTWVDTGPNGDLAPEDLEDVLDPATMDDLMQQTGLGRAELLQRLSAILPEAVDKMTPEGRLPTIEEARGIY